MLKDAEVRVREHALALMLLQVLGEYSSSGIGAYSIVAVLVRITRIHAPGAAPARGSTRSQRAPPALQQVGQRHRDALTRRAPLLALLWLPPPPLPPVFAHSSPLADTFPPPPPGALPPPAQLPPA